MCCPVYFADMLLFQYNKPRVVTKNLYSVIEDIHDWVIVPEESFDTLGLKIASVEEYQTFLVAPFRTEIAITE